MPDPPEELLSLAARRQLLSRLGDTPEALRDLSVSLNNVGRIAEARGAILPIGG